jgi:5-methylcytosine-specific restriction endonuclease McrA
MTIRCETITPDEWSPDFEYCRVCDVLKPLAAFATRKENGKRRSDCNACVYARVKAWRAENGARNNAQRRKRYAEPDCKRLEQSKKFNKEWRKAHPDKSAVRDRANHRLRKARKRGADGKYTQADLDRIRRQQKDKCGCCRSPLHGGGTLDHIVALIRGGSNWPNNLQFLCQPCNSGKKDRDAIDFMRSRGRLL